MDNLTQQQKEVKKPQRVEKATKDFKRYIAQEFNCQQKKRKQDLFNELKKIYDSYLEKNKPKEEKVYKFERKGAVKDLEKFVDLVKNGQKDEILEKYVALVKEKDSVRSRYAKSGNGYRILFHLIYGQVFENFEKLGEQVKNYTKGIETLVGFIEHNDRATGLSYQGKISLENFEQVKYDYYDSDVQALTTNFSAENLRPIEIVLEKFENVKRKPQPKLDELSTQDHLGNGENLRQEIVDYRHACLHMVKVYKTAKIVLDSLNGSLCSFAKANDLEGVGKVLKWQKKYREDLQTDLQGYKTAVENICQFLNDKDRMRYDKYINNWKENIGQYETKLARSVIHCRNYSVDKKLLLSSMKNGSNPLEATREFLVDIKKVLREIPFVLHQLPAEALRAN